MNKTKLALLLLTFLLAGVCIGFFTNSAIIKARVRRYREIPRHLSEHIVEKLTEGLDLTAEQQQAVQAHVDEYVEQRQQERRVRKARNAERMAEMSRNIALHLTPEQQAEYQVMMGRSMPQRRTARDLMRTFRQPAGDSNAVPPGK